MTRSISRREFLKCGAVGLAAAALGGCGSGAGGPGAHEFGFLVVNDMHYRGAQDAGYFEAAFDWMRVNRSYDFVLVAGDLSENGTAAQMTDVRTMLGRLGAPWYAVPGNHDYLTGPDVWTGVFGTEALNFGFEHRGWTFLGLDSTWGGSVSKVTLPADRLDWIKAAVTGIPAARPIAAFTHFPLAPEVMHTLVNGTEVLAAFAGRNLKNVFSGHYHGLSTAVVGGVTLTTDRCLSPWKENYDGSFEKGFFQCYASPTRVRYEFVRYSGLF